jgi:DDE superfamily endonuclease/Tc5 transposase DNA-binding domain
MADSNEDLDERAIAAAAVVRRERAAGERVSVAAVARQYRVDRKRVSRRLEGIGGRSSRKPVNKKLSDIQENALFRYIHTLDEIGVSLRWDEIGAVADSILEHDHIGDDPSSTVGGQWARRFFERYPDLKKAKQKHLELQRKLAHQPAVLQNWFERFKELKERFAVQNEDIWNLDETGFRVGVGKNQWIVTTSTSKRSYLAADHTRDFVTAVEAVNAGGVVIEPMFILPGKVHMDGFFLELPDEVLVDLSDTAYTNDELTYEWIFHFERQSKKTQRGAHRILLCDGYGSHLTRQLLEFCEEKLIHLFALPPHSSHLLQPLDVVLFQPYKHFHAKAVDRATRKGCTHFDKYEFLAAITSIRAETFKRNSILSSFRECGLIPYNPQIVLKKA